MAKKKQAPQEPESPSGAEPAQSLADAQPPETDKDARQWAMFCHLAGLAGYLPILPCIGSIIAPLIVWQVKKHQFAFVDEQGKEAVNFQLSILLYAVVGAVACLVTCIGAPLAVVLVPVVYFIGLVFLLIAGVKANNGEHYRYPLCIRFIK